MLLALVIVEVSIHVAESRTGPLFFAGLENPLARPHPILLHEHVPNRFYRVGSLKTEHPSGYKDLRTNNLGLREDKDTLIQALHKALRGLCAATTNHPFMRLFAKTRS